MRWQCCGKPGLLIYEDNLLVLVNVSGNLNAVKKADSLKIVSVFFSFVIYLKQQPEVPQASMMIS